jgi:hypothetical protein
MPLANLDHGADYSLKNRTGITILEIFVNQIIEMLGNDRPQIRASHKLYSMND